MCYQLFCSSVGKPFAEGALRHAFNAEAVGAPAAPNDQTPPVTDLYVLLLFFSAIAKKKDIQKKERKKERRKAN